ncbi:MAG: ribonuclease domain-containing protein [Eubacterium sp.]
MQKSIFDSFKPVYQESDNYKNWIAILDEKTCVVCRENHGRIFPLNEYVLLSPPVHNKCRCQIKIMKTILAGGATVDGLNGADYYIKAFGKLPDNYISVSEAKKLGWKPFLGNLDKVAPNKMITNGVFLNRERKLPSKNGRIWYEADINYSHGYRNSMRIVFSNDGLIFATYDHYQTFYEII